MRITSTFISMISLPGLVMTHAAPTWAQAGDEDDALVFQMDAIVVEDTARRQVDDVELELHSGFVNVIERDNFKSSVQTAADVVRQEAGLQIRQSGGVGSFASASLRGSSSQQVIIYLDGMPLNSAGSAGFDLGSIELADIESVEIFRGATPMHLPQASIGGAINIKRLRHSGVARRNLTLGAGSFGTRKYSVFTDNSVGAVDYIISLSHAESDNDYWFWDTKGTEFDQRDDEYSRRENAGFNQQTSFARADYALTTESTISISHQYQHKKQQLPSWNNMADNRTSLEKFQHHAQLAWSTRHVGALDADLMTRLDIRTNREDYDDRQGNFGLDKEHIRYSNNSEGLTQLIELPWRQHLTLLNINTQHEQSTPTDLSTHNDKPTSTRYSATLGMQDHWQASDDFSLIPGLRLYRIRDQIHTQNDTLLATNVNTTINHRYVAPQLGSKYWLNDNLVIKANIGRYFREPKFYELFGNQGFFLSNPELKAESGLTADAGLSWTPATLSPILHQARLEVAVFRTDIDNIIIQNFHGGYTKTVNIEKALIQGLESQINLAAPQRLELQAGFTWVDARNLSRAELPLYNKRLPGRYAEKFNLRVSKHWQHIATYLDWLIESGAYYDATNLLPTDKNLVDIGISYHNKHWQLSWDISNITAHRYQDYYRYPMPERSHFISFKLDF